MSKLDQVFQDINKEFKWQLATKGLRSKQLPKIPFTSPYLNYMTRGGIERGIICEFFGMPSGGKSSVALDLCGNAQRLFQKEWEDKVNELKAIEKPNKTQQKELEELLDVGAKKVVYVDTENTVRTKWAKILGVDTETIEFIKPLDQTAEQIFQMILDVISTGEVGLVVLDSLAVMVSQQAFEKDMTEKTYAGISAALSTFASKVSPLCTKYECTLVGINQQRDDMNAMYAGAKKTPGGQAWKFMCSLRYEFRKGALLDIDGNEIKKSSVSAYGNKIDVSTEKNKMTTPDRLRATCSLSYKYGIDEIADTADMAESLGIIEKGGAWYSIQLVDEETGEITHAKEDYKYQGRTKLLNFLESEEGAEVLEIIKQKLHKEIMREED